MKGLLRVVLLIVALISLLGCEDTWVPVVDNIEMRTDGKRA
jgi:hypothetical protein